MIKSVKLNGMILEAVQPNNMIELKNGKTFFIMKLLVKREC